MALGLDQIVDTLHRMSSEASAAARKIEREAQVLSRKHVAALRAEAKEKIIGGLLDLATKLGRDPEPPKPEE